MEGVHLRAYPGQIKGSVLVTIQYNNKRSLFMKDKVINILAISGSLKSTSVNTSILRAISKIAPQKVIINVFDGLDKLPHFNPESANDIETVNDFRQQLRVADGVIFSTPEYAFGVPGVLKNALDWVVSSGELNEKPVVAISASPLYSGALLFRSC